MSDLEKRRAALDAALAQVKKAHGDGAVMVLGEVDSNSVRPHISTGSIVLDNALGIGGYPKGRVVEIYGPESSGKSTLALQAVASAQKEGGLCAFIDAEHALDPVYAKALGVNLDELVLSQPDNGEQALEIADTLIRSGSLSVVVVDSVAALVPRAEIEGEMGDSHVGLQARLMSQALRKITGSLNNTNTTAIFINQIREKIGGMGYGPNETTTGGRALKFYASVRLDIRRIGAVKEGDAIVGNRTKVKVAKNKVAPPFKVAEFDILYGFGVSKPMELLDLGVEHKIVSKAAAWYKYNDLQLGNGKGAARQFLLDHPDIADEIEHRVRVALGMLPDDTVPPVPLPSGVDIETGEILQPADPFVGN